MAKSSNNVITHGLSGTVGGMLVFRQQGNKTIVAKRPSKRTTALKESEMQVQERFKAAASYAKVAIKDPVLKELYQAAAKPGQTAYNVAFADYFSAPVVKEISSSLYTGAVDSKIQIQVIEDFKVASVKVEIFGADQTLLESGDAVSAGNDLDWSYKATLENADLEGTKITVSAKDLAGNITVKSLIL